MAAAASPGPKKKRPAWLIPVVTIVVILVVVLAAYFVLLRPGGGTPSVNLDYALTIDGNETVVVLGATPSYPLSSFSARIVRWNETVGLLDPLADGAVNGTLIFRDMDHDGRLSAGDRFLSYPDEAGPHTLTVYYQGSQVGTQFWSMTPLVGLMTPGPAAGRVVLTVLASSAPVRLSEFAASVLRNVTVIGRIDPLADGASNGNLSFSDVDHDGHLSTGDRFTVDTVAPGAYELAMEWMGARGTRSVWTI